MVKTLLLKFLICALTTEYTSGNTLQVIGRVLSYKVQ